MVTIKTNKSFLCQAYIQFLRLPLSSQQVLRLLSTLATHSTPPIHRRFSNVLSSLALADYFMAK